MHIADPRKILLRKEEGRTEAKSLIQHKIFGHFVYIFPEMYISKVNDPFKCISIILIQQEKIGQDKCVFFFGSGFDKILKINET